MGMAAGEDATETLRATVERSNHGQRLEVREGVQRVQDGVTVLLRVKGAEPAHQAAAERYYRDYAYALHGIADADSKSGAAGDLHSAMLARTRAVATVNTIRCALRTAGMVRLNALVIEGMSFASMARMIYGTETTTNQSKTAGQCALVLEQLADLYAEMDRARPATKENRLRKAGPS